MAKSSTLSVYLPTALEALRAFSIAPGEVTLVAHAENLTFRVKDGAGETVYALRLHRPGYRNLEELQSEAMWTEALAAAGVPIPRTACAADGRSHVSVYVEARDEHRFASVTHWVHGRALSEVVEEARDPRRISTHLRSLGEIIARMHDQATDWRPPTSFMRPRLDVDALTGDSPVWGRFDLHPSLSADERRLLLQTRDAVQVGLQGCEATSASFGLIHGDIHPANVIVGESGLHVLDFDDVAYGWRLYDIAVGLFYLQASARCEDAGQALLAGYHSVRKLDAGALEALPFFVLARGLMLIGWFEQRPKLSTSDAFIRLKAEVIRQCSEGIGRI